MRWVLLTILGVILLVILRKIASKRREAAGGSGFVGSGERSDVSIFEARVGDQLEIDGVGERYEEVRLSIDRRSRYESGGETWYEMSGNHRGERVYVEAYEDDEPEVTVQLEAARLSLDDLGLGDEDLARMDDERSSSNNFSYGEETWRYVSSEEIGYSKNDRSALEGYYNWDFESADGRRVLFVEKWEDEPFVAGIAYRVHPDDVRVFRR